MAQGLSIRIQGQRGKAATRSTPRKGAQGARTAIRHQLRLNDLRSGGAPSAVDGLTDDGVHTIKQRDVDVARTRRNRSDDVNTANADTSIKTEVDSDSRGERRGQRAIALIVHLTLPSLSDPTVTARPTTFLFHSLVVTRWHCWRDRPDPAAARDLE
jgi:hypothetical protein